MNNRGIGEIFVSPGRTCIFQIVDSEGTCDGCFNDGPEHCHESGCSARNRPDGKSVKIINVTSDVELIVSLKTVLDSIEKVNAKLSKGYFCNNRLIISTVPVEEPKEIKNAYNTKQG